MANIRLQDKDGTYNVFNGIDSVVLPTSDGQWATFSRGGGGGTVTVRRTYNRSSALPKMELGQKVPTATGDAATLKISAQILVPLDETIEDVSYIAGVQGGMWKSSDPTNGVTPAVEWNAEIDTITKTITSQPDGNLVKVEYDPTKNSIITNLFESGYDEGAMKGTVFLIVTSSK